MTENNDLSIEKLQAIKDYLEELLQDLPPELSDLVKNLHKLTISMQAELELAERHQRQALNDMAQLGEILITLRQCSYKIADASQKFNLLAGLIKALEIDPLPDISEKQA